MMSQDSKPKDKLLGAETLSGVRIAVSASESPDLNRLGLVEIHFRLALGEIARSVLVSGGKLAYGGHLEPNGYTTLLMQELQRYGRRDRPLKVCLAWQEHRKLPLEEIDAIKRDLGLLGEIVCLDPEGCIIDSSVGRDNAPEFGQDEIFLQKSLTALRGFVTSETNARVLIGGKREGFQGEMPGVLEEAILSIEKGQPLYLAGGFGGATTDVITALAIADQNWLPQTTPSERDRRLTDGLLRLATTAKASNWDYLANGLTAEENQKLAATHRPTEIAALISLGLGRRFASRR